MKSLYLISEFVGQPWAIQPERLSIISAVLARWAANGTASDAVMASVRADHAEVEARRSAAASSGGASIGVLPLYGTVVQRTSVADDVSGSGFMSLTKFVAQLRAMADEPSVKGIVLDIDSPGGSVYGTQEAANEIMALRGKKPVYAVANSLAASAAYWIASAASEFYITPGGEAGSIGVFAAHRDMSAALEKEGIKTTLISAGKYKTEGNPFGPLSDEAQAAMQSRIDAYYGAFTRGVAKARGVDVAAVREGMGQGRVLGASDAVAAKMADGVMTFDEVLSKLARDVSAAPAGKSGKMARQRRELDLLSRSF